VASPAPAHVVKDLPPPPPEYASPPPRPADRSGLGSLGRLAARVKGILFAPRAEWPLVAREDTSAARIYLAYVAPLAAIGALAAIVGAAYVGVALPFENVARLRPGAAVVGAFAHFLLTFATVFVVALIVDRLAPTFGGQRDARRALQVTAYSFTPAWVAAALAVVPALGAIAGFVGLYGLYLLYLGLPVLMHAPADKSLGYTVVVVICTIALTIAVALSTGILITLFAPSETGTVQA
jgi:hypothetical protein